MASSDSKSSVCVPEVKIDVDKERPKSGRNEALPPAADKSAATPIFQLDSQPMVISAATCSVTSLNSPTQTSTVVSGQYPQTHGNLLSHSVNVVRARRSLESDFGSNGRSVGSPNRSGGCSPQTSHAPNLSEILSMRPSIERALLMAGSGSHQIPDNHNTTLINQLNKNYLKSICRQNKARNDWKSLKSKLTALRRRDSAETKADASGSGSGSGSTSGSVSLQPPCSGTSSKRGSLETSNVTTASTSNANDVHTKRNPGQDEGIICKKEDLMRLLQSATPGKQSRKPLKSISDVVLQLRSDGRLNSSKKKSTPESVETEYKECKEKNISVGVTSHVKTNVDKPKEGGVSGGKSSGGTSSASSNSPAESHEDAEMKKMAAETKGDNKEANKELQIKSMLKSTCSNSNRNKSTGFASSQNTVKKKKVKIVDSEPSRSKSVRSSKDKSGANRKSGQSTGSTSSKIDDAEQEELEERLRRECLHDHSNDECQRSQTEEHSQVKWDDGNLVDAAALGDAIQAFLRGISSASSEKKVSFKR